MSERHTRVRASQIKYIEPADINAINSPSSGNSVHYASGSKFEWTDRGLPFSNVILISGSQYRTDSFETVLCYTENTNIRIYLPSSHREGDQISVKAVNFRPGHGYGNRHKVEIFPASNQKIDNYNWWILLHRNSIMIVSDGNDWWMLSRS